MQAAYLLRMDPTDPTDPTDSNTTSAPQPPSGIAIPISVPAPMARIRRRWDLAASLGARPHVTILYPFLPGSLLTARVRADLAAIARSVEPFEVYFGAVRRFDDVIWIEPEPAVPFRLLTAAVVARWPECPPYGGIFADVIPHLTVAESATAVRQDMEATIAAALPFARRATTLEVWRQDEARRWHPHWRLPLGVRP